MIQIAELDRLDHESMLGWQIRSCLAKKNNETDLDWSEIKEKLNWDMHPDNIRKVAVGIKMYDDYIKELNGEKNVATRILSISDAHVPFNLPPSSFSKYAGKIDILVFNGDIEDCHSCSRFPKKYRIGFDKEMVATRQYFIDVINLIKPKKVHVILGNHEYRLQRFLNDNLYDDILSIMPDSPLELIINKGFHVKDRLNRTETWYSPLVDVYKEDNISIEYDGSWYKRIGNVLFAHPLSYSSGMLRTTKKAVDFFIRKDRDFSCMVLGHTHKIGSFKESNILMYEQGCTCDLSKLDYNDGMLVIPGQNGYLYLALDNEGNVIQNLSKIETI